MPERKHAKYSPSKFAYLRACPGQANAIAALPEAVRKELDKPTDDSIRGTRLHALRQFMVQQALEKKGITWPTEVLDDDGARHIISSQDVEACRAVVNWYLKHPAVRRFDEPGFHVWQEPRLEIGKWLGAPEGICAGYPDVVLATPNKLDVCDDKYGYWLVSPECDQIRLYGFASSALIYPEGHNRNEWAQCRELGTHILQPANGENPHVGKDWKIDILSEWQVEFAAILKTAMNPDAPRVPGDDQCRFCIARNTKACSESIEKVPKDITAMFGQPPSDVSGKPEAPPPIASVDQIVELADVHMTQPVDGLTNEQLSEIKDRAPFVKTFFKECDEEAKRRAEAGQTIPHWKLVDVPGKRGFPKDEAGIKEARRVLLEELKMRKATAIREVFVTVGEFEKSVARFKKEEKRDRALSVLIKGKGSRTLAPDSDPRASSVETMFGQPDQDPVPSLEDLL